MYINMYRTNTKWRSRWDVNGQKVSTFQRYGYGAKKRTQGKSKEKNFPNSFAFKQGKSIDNTQSRGSIKKEMKNNY